MSEATRSAALAHAVAIHGGDGHKAVLEAAKAFDVFIAGGNPPAAETAPKASTAKPVNKAPLNKGKPAAEADEEATVTKATRKAAAAAEAEDQEEGGTEGGGETLEEVETAVADLLGANKRKGVVALLAEYNAKSASGVKASDRGAFLQAAQDLLLGA
jgi:hypothetical protein